MPPFDDDDVEYKWLHYTFPDGSAEPRMLDHENIRIGPPQTLGKSGLQACPVAYMDGTKQRPLEVQFPLFYSPFEMNFPYSPPGQPVKKSQRKVSVSFKGEDHRPELTSFREMVEGIDNRFIDVLLENYTAWFGHRAQKNFKKNRDTIGMIVQPLIRPPKKGDYPDMIDLKITVKNPNDAAPQIECAFWNEDDQALETAEEINLRGANIVVVAVLEWIYCASGKLYPKFRAVQIKIYEAQRHTKTYSIIENGNPTKKRGRDEESVEDDEVEDDVSNSKRQRTKDADGDVAAL